MDVTSPDRVADRWDLEADHAPRFRAAAVTWVRTFFPAWLWSKVRLEVPVRPLRLAGFVLVTLVAAHLVIAAAIGLANWRVEFRAAPKAPPLFASGLIPRPPTVLPLSPDQEAALEVQVSRGLFLAWPSMANLASERSVRDAALLWSADVGAAVKPEEMSGWYAAVLAARPAILAEQERVNALEAAEVGWEAARFPYSRFAISLIDDWWGRRASTLLALPVLTVALMPAACLLLRRSMHKASVTPAHLLRASAYTVPPAAAVLTLALAGVALKVVDEVDAANKWLPGPGAVRATLAAAGLWAAAWFLRTWWCFLRRYLRLPHAAVAIVLMTLLSFAASVALCYFALDREGIIRASIDLFPRSRFFDP
jgi:hypothetical protein